MLKKLLSSLFAFTVFMSIPAFTAAEMRAFAFMPANNGAAQAGNNLQNDIHLARDYSKVMVDVCKNFVNDIASFVIALDFGKNHAGFYKAVKESNFFDGIIFQQCSGKKIFAAGSFTEICDIKVSGALNAALFFLVLAFMLQYIGLLRLFSGDSFFTKQIKL